MMLNGFTSLQKREAHISDVLASFLNFIYPPTCPFCREKVEKNGMICSGCWPDLTLIEPPFCARCSTPLEVAFQEEQICGQCLLYPPAFSEARSVFGYGPLTKHLVLRFKNHHSTALAAFMGKKMLEKSKDMIEASDFIVPVPLHPKRLQERGYNQATLLAYHVAKDCRHKVQPTLLVRLKNTPSQGTLSKGARQKNVEKAFSLNPKIKKESLTGKTVTLVDDVMTTGATLSASAKAFEGSGVKKVNVVVFSRTIR